ncbi:MAG: energy transducer TonB [Mangrovibacterium sp.]
MELKKSNKADLENKKNIFLQAGLVLALGITLFAFEYKTHAEQVVSLGTVQEQTIEEEIIPITRMEIQKPPPPPPPKVVEILNIVEDDVELEEELELESIEDNNAPIDIAPIFQQGTEATTDSEIFIVVEQMPEFPGGVNAMRAYLAKNVKYPVVALENGLQGTVYISFVVNQDGSIVDVTVLRGVDSSLDKEAVRVVQSMPKWKPGKQGGKPVRVSYQVPISFKLQ